MKNFILKTISSVLRSIVVFVILFFLIISLLTEKFPPDFNLAKEYISDLRNSREKFSSLLRKSENHLNKELESENEPVNTSVADVNSGSLNIEIKHIRSQLDRIEQQNDLILKSLKK